MALGLGLPLTKSIKPSPPLLDQVSGCVLAWSIERKLKSTNTNAIRVREDGGGTEADIGFAGSAFDSAALLAHTGSNNGFATKAYDLSGESNDGSQTTASFQPQVVTSGVFDGCFTYPGGGSDTSLKVAPNSALNVQNMSVFAKVNVTDYTSQRTIFSCDTNSGIQFAVKSNGKLKLAERGVFSASESTTAITTGADIWIGATYDSSDVRYYLGNSLDKTDSRAYTFSLPSTYYMGIEVNAAELLGCMYELLVFDRKLDQSEIDKIVA